MSSTGFVNYYKLLGITEAEARLTARAKIKAALTLNHPDKHPAALKEIYTEKSAILSVGFSIFNDESALEKWRRNHFDSIWQWFRCVAAKGHTPMAEYVPAGYLQWLGENRGVWYDLKNISAWKAAQQQEPSISQGCQLKAAKETANPTAQGTEIRQKFVAVWEKDKEKTTVNASKRFVSPKTQTAGPKAPMTELRRYAASHEYSRARKMDEQDSEYEPPEYVVIIDDDDDGVNDDDEAGGPSSRTRSKTLKARARPGFDRDVHGIHADDPLLSTTTRKRKRGNDQDLDSGAASFLTKRVSRPY